MRVICILSKAHKAGDKILVVSGYDLELTRMLNAVGVISIAGHAHTYRTTNTIIIVGGDVTIRLKDKLRDDYLKGAPVCIHGRREED